MVAAQKVDRHRSKNGGLRKGAKESTKGKGFSFCCMGDGWAEKRKNVKRAKKRFVPPSMRKTGIYATAVISPPSTPPRAPPPLIAVRSSAMDCWRWVEGTISMTSTWESGRC